jgi:hypothetical protein
LLEEIFDVDFAKVFVQKVRDKNVLPACKSSFLFLRRKGPI